VRLWPLLLVLMLFVAGCGSKGDKGPAPVEVEEPVGNLISGVVVTPTIQPIPGARITLTPGDLSDTADLFGKFRFEDLEAGTYRIKAEVEGYDPKQVTVVVKDDEVSRPRVIMEPILPPVARHDTIPYQGFIKSNFGQADGPLDPYKETIGMDGCECQFYFSIPRYTVTVTIEVIWGDSIGTPDGAPQPAYRWAVSTLSLSHIATGSGPDPIVVHLNKDSFDGDAPINFESAGAMTLKIQGDENIPTTDQQFSVFVTLWEVEEPPSTWSFVGGDR
jgi:hypothetical protein